MEKQQFSGKSLDAALDEAAKFFSTDKVFIRYNILQNHSGGFLAKLFLRSIKIEAWIETSKQDLQAAAREVVRQTLNKKSDVPQKKPAHRIVTDEASSHSQTAPVEIDAHVLEVFENFKNTVFSALMILEKDIKITRQGNEINITISDDTVENFLSKSDKLSFSFEHILKRMIQKKYGEIPLKVRLNAGKSAEKREEHLAKMAHNLAEKVRKTGKSIVLTSKSNTERKAIHLALDKATGVATKSIGTGENRRLVIYSLDKQRPSHHHKRKHKRKVN